MKYKSRKIRASLIIFDNIESTACTKTINQYLYLKELWVQGVTLIVIPAPLLKLLKCLHFLVQHEVQISDWQLCIHDHSKHSKNGNIFLNIVINVEG